MQIRNPNVIISHHNQSFDECAKSVECFTINVHFASDNPKPDKAPYRPTKGTRELNIALSKCTCCHNKYFTCYCMTEACQ